MTNVHQLLVLSKTLPVATMCVRDLCFARFSRQTAANESIHNLSESKNPKKNEKLFINVSHYGQRVFRDMTQTVENRNSITRPPGHESGMLIGI
jgi:hypothetical protein